MKRISYTKTFPIAAYCTEKIGIEMDIPDDADVQDNLRVLKDEVHQFHLQNNPQINYDTFQETTTKNVESPEDSWIKEIENCKTQTDIDKLKYLSKSTNPIIKEAYLKKLNEINQ